MKYHVAFLLESGNWDIVRDLRANNDEHAMQITESWVEKNYPDRDDWYVLDQKKNNINS